MNAQRRSQLSAVIRLLATEADLSLSAGVQLLARNGRLDRFTIAGIAIPAFRAPYPQWTPAAVYVSPGAARAVAGGEPAGLSEAARSQSDALYVLGLPLQDSVNTLDFAFQPSNASLMEWLPNMRASIIDEANASAVLLRIFSIFAVIAAAFIAVATITNHAASQARDIGLLKAVGLTPEARLPCSSINCSPSACRQPS